MRPDALWDLLQLFSPIPLRRPKGGRSPLRLQAFKAQAQCRATFETIALSKNPPVFARQANIAQGPQQINNTMSVARAFPDPRRTNYWRPMTTIWRRETAGMAVPASNHGPEGG
jgi:hypothetical protein